MSTTSESIYIAYETYFQMHLGYSLTKDEAIEIAKKRYQQIHEEGPDTWNHVIVRQLPLGKLLSHEDEWNAPIVWESEPETSD